MSSEKKELRQALKWAIKGLILQEVRALQLEQAHSASFVLDEMVYSIQEAKGEIIGLVQSMPSKERDALIKRLILQSVDEEIDQTIQVRKNRCFRCTHVRYFDEEGSSHVNLPYQGRRVRVIGCEEMTRSSRVRCRNFAESPTALSIEDYLSEMAFLYEVKEMFDQFDEIWDYLTRETA